jgi:hypothetical protein
MTVADPNANFGQYRTFSSFHQSPPEGVDPVKYRRVSEAIDRRLAAAGFTKAVLGDFAVSFAVAAHGVDAENGPVGGSQHQARGSTREDADGGNNENTLSIEVSDTRTGKLVWYGQVAEGVGSGASRRQVERAIDALLAKFPPKAGDFSEG